MTRDNPLKVRDRGGPLAVVEVPVADTVVDGVVRKLALTVPWARLCGKDLRLRHRALIETQQLQVKGQVRLRVVDRRGDARENVCGLLRLPGAA